VIGKRIISYIDTAADLIPLQDCIDFLDAIRVDQNTLISNQLTEAIAWASNIVGFSLRRATVDYYFDQYEPSEITTNARIRGGLRIPANVISITSVSYRDEDGNYTAIAAADYDYDNHGDHIPMVKIINTPSAFYEYGAGYKVRVVEGYYGQGGSPSEESESLPYDIRRAILMKLKDMYDFRGNTGVVQTSELIATAEHYLYPYCKLQIL
jgi:uncharacterized phiE125 gp8 family phage protein